MDDILDVTESYDLIHKPLFQGMASVHEIGADPCVCDGWDDPVKKYGKAIKINFEKGLLCSSCGKKLNEKGLAWFKNSL